MLGLRQSVIEEEPKKYISDLPFPLPEAPPGQCRDAFLKELLAPYESESLSLMSYDSDDSIISTKVRFGSDTNAEEKLYIDFVRGTRFEFDRSMRKSMQSRSMSLDVNMNAPDIYKMLKYRYKDIANAIGFVAVLFHLTDIRHRMNVVRDMWEMSTSADRSLRMFSWSIKDYFVRFNMRNLVYLDAFELQLQSQMDCYKFRVDLKEFIRLLDVIYEDYKNRCDICSNAMEIIKDSQTDIMQLLINTQQEAIAQQAQLAKDMQRGVSNDQADNKLLKQLKNKVIHMDFVAPIEARYRINWAQTLMEQSLMYDDGLVKAVEDEVNSLRTRARESSYLFDMRRTAYEMEIDNYRTQIEETEEQLEKSMEMAETEIKVTRNKLSKAKEDLKFYMGQVPIFHEKIAAVMAILAPPPEPEPVEEPVQPVKKPKGAKKGKK